MAPRASIMVIVLLAAFLSPLQSLALPSGACHINSGLNADKTGTYDTKQDPGHVYCCTNQGQDCTECLGNACTSGANRHPSAGTNSGPSGGGNTGAGVGLRPSPRGPR
jgi:hypothetical protein